MPSDATSLIPSTADIASQWGVDPSVIKAQPAVPSSIVVPDGAVPPVTDLAKQWGIDPSVVSADLVISPRARIDTAAAKLGVPAGAPLPDKLRAISKATRGHQQQLEGAASVQDSPARSAALATVGNVVSGIPIAGPALQGLVQRGAAGVGSMATGDPYADTLARIQGAQNEADAEHPGLAAAGGIAGGVLGYGMAAGAGVGPALGLSGSFGQRALLGGLSNAAIGGADSAVRGSSPATGALTGAALGGAAPFAGKLVGKGVGALTSALSGILPTGVQGLPRAAVNLLANAFHADDPAAVQSELHRFGDTGMLADAGPSFGGLAQGLATKPGEAKSVLYNALNARAGGANARMTGDLTHALGPAEDPQAVSDAIIAHRRAVDAVNYSRALGSAPPVNTTRVVAMIDNQLPTAVGMQQRALQNLRRMLVEPANPATAAPPSFRSDASLLHNVKGEIDNVINHDAPGLGVPPGAVNRAQGSLRMIRGALNDTLERQVPGYADANAASAALARRAEAVQTGTSVLDSGKTAQTPEAFAHALASMSPGERIALNKGLRGEINRIVGTKSNDVAAVRSALQGEGGWNTAKLAAAFGQQPTDHLVNALGREAAYSGTMNRVVSNSQTAQRAGAAALLKDTDPAQYDFGKANVTGLVIQGIKKFGIKPVLNALFHTDNTPRDLAIAHALTAQGAGRDTMISNIIDLVSRRSAMAATGGRVGNALQGATNFLIPAAGGSYQRSPSSR